MYWRQARTKIKAEIEIAPIFAISPNVLACE